MAYFILRVCFNLKRVQYVRFFEHNRNAHSEKNGLVRGVYDDEPGKVVFSKVTERFNEATNGKLCQELAVPCSTSY
ncbi:hypothetical protein R5R35_007301 [Gryllus longicercus]|uniref:Uncharacterized protein n=1 Tax=Gryllus longicercus TaxID=2509291 RepID=A0AAN9VAY9_9ORTH